MTIVCAVHHIGIASLLADCVWWIDRGCLIGSGPAGLAAAQQLTRAEEGRQALARGLQAQLARARRPFASVLAGEAA